MRQIVDIETRVMTIAFPASGSLYYRRDLGASDAAIPMPSQLTSDEIVVGPIAQFEWWYQKRALLDIDRGPCTYFPLRPKDRASQNLKGVDDC